MKVKPFKEERMNTRRLRSKAVGQSIPFIALMIVVLFGMVGLAVDVGNTYAEQRDTVRAANAASLAGMNAMIQNSSNPSDAAIREAIVASLESNGIEVASTETGLTGDTRRLNAYYLGADGNPLVSCNIGSCGVVPAGVKYIQVQLEGFTDTYFARVVGRETLPVGAQAFSTQCAPVDNVFPIGIRSDYLDSEGFIEPTDEDEKPYYGKYSDEHYRDKWGRRIYLKDNSGVAGGFSYLRWLSHESYGNAPGLARMLTGDGNLEEGFEEAPWPDGVPGKPDGYPIRPGQFSPGDWIHGNSGLSGSSEVINALENHIAKRTEMILPIIQNEKWQGNNAVFHVGGFGKFLLREYGHQSNKGRYMDLVYLGKADNVACNLTNVPTGVNTLSVKGDVFILPREQEIPSSRQPIEYVILLDTSGSMNWNFAGQAHVSGRVRQCTMNPATYDANDPSTHPIACGSAKWNTKEERRIYFAKQAIMKFVDLIEPQDAMTIIGYSSADYNMNPTGTRQFGTPDGKSALKQFVLMTGASLSDPYTVGGGTPSPRALMRSREVIAGLPEVASNGLEFKRVVIFLTDGVANHFDKRYNVPWGSNQWRNLAKDDPDCAADSNVDENVSCQTGHVNNDENGIMRPITAMVYHGMQLHDDDVLVYAMMMGPANKTGLDQVASQPTFPWYSTANNDADVEEIFERINNNIENGECIPRPSGNWISEIEPQNEPGSAPTFGWVIVYDQNNVEQTKVPITHDSTTGKLTYEINDLAPGTYRVEAWVDYVGDDDILRQYSRMYIPGEETYYLQGITFDVKPSDTLNNTVIGPQLYLDLNGDVCPAETGP